MAHISKTKTNFSKIPSKLFAQINETYICKLTFIVGFMKVVTRHTQELHENASQ